MTKAKVQLCYELRASREIIVTFNGAPKGQRLMNAIEKAVEKATETDKEWTRWNLVDVLSSEADS